MKELPYADLLTQGRRVLEQQEFSRLVGTSLDVFRPGSAELSLAIARQLLGERKRCAAAQGTIRRAD